jgi:hypothetical protein
MRLSILVPNGWHDTTWRHDQMPSIEPVGNDSIRIWVDDTTCSHQTAMGIDGAYRFILSQRDEDGNFRDVFESDNLSTILSRIP